MWLLPSEPQTNKSKSSLLMLNRSAMRNMRKKKRIQQTLKNEIIKFVLELNTLYTLCLNNWLIKGILAQLVERLYYIIREEREFEIAICS
jgi:hypothetical protein